MCVFRVKWEDSELESLKIYSEFQNECSFFL